MSQTPAALRRPQNRVPNSELQHLTVGCLYAPARAAAHHQINITITEIDWLCLSKLSPAIAVVRPTYLDSASDEPPPLRDTDLPASKHLQGSSRLAKTVEGRGFGTKSDLF